MTVQWTLVATFLYLELGFIFLLLLPFISPKVCTLVVYSPHIIGVLEILSIYCILRWQYALFSRMCRVVADKANIYFTVFIIVLIFFFVDSVREMLNYSSKTSVDLGQELQIHLKLFRSQRNYYISGFTVFLWLVIRRLVTLVLNEADLLSETESAMKRAQNATETVEKILKRKEEEEKETSSTVTKFMKELSDLRNALEEAENELCHTKKAVEDVRQKSLSVSKEYEDLLENYTALLNKKNEKEEEICDEKEEEKCDEKEEEKCDEKNDESCDEKNEDECSSSST